MRPARNTRRDRSRSMPSRGGLPVTRRRLLVTSAALGIAGQPRGVAALAAPPDDLVGRNHLHTVRRGDVLVDIAVAYGVGYGELAAANPDVDPWQPAAGTELVIPGEHILPAAPRRGIVLNLAELRLYHFGGDGVTSMPIGIGNEGTGTPIGGTTITGKRKNPAWWPSPSIGSERPELPSAVPSGPDNPLGDYVLELGWPLYRIHGTNLPYGVGRRGGHGCIRMYPGDIERLYAAVEVGTPVRVVDQPIKAGWRHGRLYLEVHPTQRQADAVEAARSIASLPPGDPAEAIRAAAAGTAAAIDWTVVGRIARARRGMPALISRQIALSAAE